MKIGLELLKGVVISYMEQISPSIIMEAAGMVKTDIYIHWCVFNIIWIKFYLLLVLIFTLKFPHFIKYSKIEYFVLGFLILCFLFSLFIFDGGNLKYYSVIDNRVSPCWLFHKVLDKLLHFPHGYYDFMFPCHALHRLFLLLFCNWIEPSGCCPFYVNSYLDNSSHSR